VGNLAVVVVARVLRTTKKQKKTGQLFQEKNAPSRENPGYACDAVFNNRFFVHYFVSMYSRQLM